MSKKVAGVEYAIRDIVESARIVEQRGTRMHYLNIGDPVQFGFQPPNNVRQAFTDAIHRGENYYAASEGMAELRSAIAKKESAKGLQVSADNILVTNGVSEALDMVISSIVEDGDEILLQGPYYPPYASYVRLRGGIPVEFAAGTKGPDIDEIRSKVTKRTVAICLINPSNPTGAVMDRNQLQSIIDLAGEYNLYIICDEIYDRIIYDAQFTGIGSVSGDSPIILLNGFSKVHLMSGWRIGYIAFNQSPGLDNIRENLPKLARVRIACSLPVQYAALESLNGPQDYIKEFVSELKSRRDLVVRRLDDIPGISCDAPKGAFYAFPRIDPSLGTDAELAAGLLERGVLTVPGSGFGPRYGSGHLRIVFLPARDELESAMDIISDHVSTSRP